MYITIAAIMFLVGIVMCVGAFYSWRYEAPLIIGGTLLIASAFMPFGIHLEMESCARKWAGSFPSKYDGMAGCMIHVDGRWIPERNFRVEPKDK